MGLLHSAQHMMLGLIFCPDKVHPILLTKSANGIAFGRPPIKHTRIGLECCCRQLASNCEWYCARPLHYHEIHWAKRVKHSLLLEQLVGLLHSAQHMMLGLIFCPDKVHPILLTKSANGIAFGRPPIKHTRIGLKTLATRVIAVARACADK